MRSTVLFSALVVACSSHTNTGSGSDSGASLADGGQIQDTGDEVLGEDARTNVLLAPRLTRIAKMAGGLHVMWENHETDCDVIEGERRSDTEPYKVVFVLPDGSVDNKHDAGVSTGTRYTYRLRCKKGEEFSPYSNELSGTP